MSQNALLIARRLSQNNPNLTPVQVESQLIKDNPNSIVMIPSRSQIRNLVKNVRQKDQIEEIPFLKNMKLLSNGETFFQK